MYDVPVYFVLCKVCVCMCLGYTSAWKNVLVDLFQQMYLLTLKGKVKIMDFVSS